MGSESKISLVQLGSHGESEIKLKSNGGCHVQKDENKTDMSTEGVESSSFAVVKPRGLRKWRRIPRDLVKKSGSNLNTRENGDVSVNGGYWVQPVFDVAGASEMGNEVSKMNGRISDLTDDHDQDQDQERNGRVGPGKKARGLSVEKEDLNSSMGSDSQRFESDDDKHLDLEAQNSDDVSLTADGIRKQEESADQDDPLVESIRGLHFAQAGFEREVQKLKDVGKAGDPLIKSDGLLHEILKLKDAKILELESMLNSRDIKAKLEDRLMKTIQMEVENVVITRKTKVLTEGSLSGIKHDDLQQNDVSLQAKKQENEKLETKEDLKKLQNKVFKFTLCLIIMLILLLVTFYLQFSSKTVEVMLVPT